MTTNNEATTNENTEDSQDSCDFSAEDSNAKQLVKKYMMWAMGASLLPVPIVTAGALLGVQLKMLGQLSHNYGVEFSQERVKSIIGSLCGTAAVGSLQRSGLTSLLRSVPVVGVIGTLSLTIYAGAVTYALGVVFTQHFASGGTFLDFNPQEAREYFKTLCEEGADKAEEASDDK
jgi:uncharacterized protein (DUF697 family)